MTSPKRVISNILGTGKTIQRCNGKNKRYEIIKVAEHLPDNQGQIYSYKIYDNKKKRYANERSYGDIYDARWMMERLSKK